MSGYQNTLTLDITIDVIERDFFAGGIFTLLITYGTFLYFLVVVTTFKIQWDEHSPMGRRDEQALIQRHGSVVAHFPDDTWNLPVPSPSFSTLSPDLPRSYVAMSKADAGSCERSIRGFQDRGGTSFSQKRTERKPTGNFYNDEHNERPAVEAKASYKFSTKAQKLIGAKAHPSTKKCIVHFGAFRPYQLRLLVAADWPLQPAECHWGGH